MKHLLYLAILLISFFSYSQDHSTDKINWMTWEEAIKENAKNPKPIFVDIYTEWCGWCKKMDKGTFSEKEVIEYMNANYYNVKFDAEQKEVIHYKNKEFKYVQAGRRGYNTLALALLDNKPQFPSFVVLNNKEQIIARIAGYQEKSSLLKALKSLK